MSERPADLPPAEPPAPRPSACGILLRRDHEGWRVLLGRRGRGARFMPGHLAFPGGGLEPVDGAIDDPGAFERCASRELREETGLEVDPAVWIDAGLRITPPIFPVRFDTRFFVALAADDARPDAAVSDGEIDTLEFALAGTVLDDWRVGRAALPPPVLALLRTLHELTTDSASRELETVARRLAQANALEEHAPRIEFVPDIWMLPLATATMPPASHTNCWMPGGARFVLVDPAAADSRSREQLLAVVERRMAAGSRPSAVLLTHGHRDHRDGAGRIARELSLPIRAHERVLGGLDDPSGVAIQPLADGETLDLEGISLRALHTPGHAPGHLAFLVPERGALIAGDLVSGLSTILIESSHGDMREYLQSLQRAASLDCSRLLPGHGPPLPGKALQRTLRHRGMRERRIIDALSGERRLEAVAQAAYADTPGLPPALVRHQTLAHLLALERVGRVRRTTDDEWESTTGSTTEQRLRSLLESRLAPLRLEIVDDSARHAGHINAATGGGHFKVTIVSAAFEGRGRLEQHRMVYEVLGEMVGREIHALGLTTLAPMEHER